MASFSLATTRVKLANPGTLHPVHAAYLYMLPQLALQAVSQRRCHLQLLLQQLLCQLCSALPGDS